jgi:hypothetical protein
MGGVSNPSVLNVDPSQAIFNAFKLQGREIADTAPTDGQALIWSVVQNKWVPGAGGAGSVSWDDINGRPDLSVYALASALNNYVLGANLATILGIYVTNSGLSTALNDYLQTSNFTWANLGGKPTLFSGDYQDLTNKPVAVRQLIYTTKTDVFITTSQSWIDIPGLTLNITPSNTNAKIRITAILKGGSTGNAHARLTRNGNPIGVGDVASGRVQAGTTDFYDYYGRSDKSLIWIDEPSTTSSLSYAVQVINVSANTLQIGASGDDAASRPRMAQFFQVEEII